MYYETLSKEKVACYLGEGFSADNVFFLADCPDSLDYYFGDSAISTKYRNIIIGGLKEFVDPSFSNNDYEAISWIGLQETDYY